MLYFITGVVTGFILHMVYTKVKDMIAYDRALKKRVAQWPRAER